MYTAYVIWGIFHPSGVSVQHFPPKSWGKAILHAFGLKREGHPRRLRLGAVCGFPVEAALGSNAFCFRKGALM